MLNRKAEELYYFIIMAYKKNYTQFSQIRKRNVREYIENYSFKERLSYVFREAGYESRYELFPEDQRGMD